MLNRISVDSDTFIRVLDNFPKYVDEVKDIKQFLTNGYPDRRRIKFCPDSKTLIVQAYRVPELNVNEDWKQLVLVCDDTIEKPTYARMVPFATTANRKMHSLLHHYYTDEEIDECLKAHTVEERRKPLHMLLPSIYHDGKIHKFTDCVYYDTNGAHTDALCEIFPKAKRRLTNLHHHGGKDIINIYVGDLCNRGYRSTFDWIVERTRTFLEDVRAKVGGGLILYANTDGIIIHHPDRHIPVSAKLGEVKSESKDGVVYAYTCKTTTELTGYTIYQYEHPTKGKQLKGNSRMVLRNGMDLSKGIVNVGKVSTVHGISTVLHVTKKELEIVDEE